MISSRCNDVFSEDEPSTLTDLRRALKKDIESEEVFGRRVFEVWINEDATSAEGTEDSWDTCLKQVRDCDVLIVLSNGNAGWAVNGQDIGICHAEYMEGLRTAQSKVRFIELPPVKEADESDIKERNQRFKDYISQQSAFRGGDIKTINDAKKRVLEAISDAVVSLTQKGVISSNSTRFDIGNALDWTRLDFQSRKLAMENTIRADLSGRDESKTTSKGVVIKLKDKKVLTIIHAVPAALSVASARELIGRPFLNDHSYAEDLKSIEGPIHLIACHRGATETQARSLLGFPDATVVSAPFGIFVADNVQKIQFVLFSNCRDDSQTRHACQRFFEWLSQTGEDVMIEDRAESRARIVKAIAGEILTN